MDNYFEQNVAGERGPREQLKYGACWAGIVLLALVALVSLTGIVALGEDSISINWGSVIAVVVSAALAVLLFLNKDKVYREYDYILWNSELEVCEIYNLKRRKKVCTIPLSRVTAWGPAAALENRMHNAKKSSWCVHEDAAWCLIYPGEDGNKAVLLELSEDMRAQLRATSSAMRSAEVRA